MVTTKVIADASVLVPNAAHRNFVAGNDVIKADTTITGDPKKIEGLRRGQPFVYRLFLTNDNKLIYLNKVNMDTTEVTLGVDSEKSSTIVNLKQNILAKPDILGAISGAAIGFCYAKWKKHDNKKMLMYVAGLAIAGFVIGKVISNKATITPGK